MTDLVKVFDPATGLEVWKALTTGGGAAPSSDVIASEPLAVGDSVNLYLVAGAARVRRAIASTLRQQADGYVTSAATTGMTATVYSSGINTGVLGLLPGTRYFLSDSTPGGLTADPVSGSGKLNQLLGITNASGALVWAPEPAIPLA